MAKFSQQLELQVDAILGATVKIRNQAAMIALAEILRRTPIGDPELWSANAQELNKQFRPDYEPSTLLANWNLGIGSQNDGFDPDAKVDSRRTVQVEMNREIYAARRSEDIFITNSTPYAPRIEYQGYSVQPGKGDMVGYAEIVFEQAVAKMNSQLANYKVDAKLARLMKEDQPNVPFLTPVPKVD